MGLPEVLDFSRDSILVLLTVAAPIMGVGLAVGIAIALVQALTQIQEMTLVFVPKILAIFLSLLLFMPFMATTMIAYMERTAQRIAGGP